MCQNKYCKVLEQQKQWHVILKTVLILIVKKGLRYPNKGEYVRIKNYERIMKSPFMVYVDFQNTLVAEDDGKKNSNKSYTNKYQKHVACSYCYELVCVDHKFSQPFKSYLLGEDAVCNFINSMIKESKAVVK